MFYSTHGKQKFIPLEKQVNVKLQAHLLVKTNPQKNV